MKLGLVEALVAETRFGRVFVGRLLRCFAGIYPVVRMNALREPALRTSHLTSRGQWPENS